MTRLIILAFAAVLSATTMSPVTEASSPSAPVTGDRFHFELRELPGERALEARFRRSDGGRDDRWNTRLAPAQLVGLDLDRFRAGGANAVRFAVTRASGRLDCTGNGGSARAAGHCSFTRSADFAQRLGAIGIGAVNDDDWLAMFALDVSPQLVEAVRAAGYPLASPDALIALTAVGVTPDYIAALAAAGYRPASLDALVELRAVGVEPGWIGAMADVGYARLPTDRLVELKALGVDATYIRSFHQAGYRDLAPGDLVQMKALGVTADFARQVEAAFGRQDPGRLVELKVLGFAPRRR